MGGTQVTETKSAATDPVVEVALGLLVEYTEKLRNLRERYMNVKYRTIYNMLSTTHSENLVTKCIRDTYNEFHSLSEQVSQRIEHAILHPLDKLNLKLKLRDFEEQVRFFDRVVVPMLLPSNVTQDPGSR
jgi:hypothetical protein